MSAHEQRRTFGRPGLPVEPAEQRWRAVDFGLGDLLDDHVAAVGQETDVQGDVLRRVG